MGYNNAKTNVLVTGFGVLAFGLVIKSVLCLGGVAIKCLFFYYKLLFVRLMIIKPLEHVVLYVVGFEIVFCIFLSASVTVLLNVVVFFCVFILFKFN